MTSRTLVWTAGAVVALVATGMAAHARVGSDKGTDPSTAVVHRSTEDPAAVERYWSPSRVREAQENMRRGNSPVVTGPLRGKDTLTGR